MKTLLETVKSDYYDSLIPHITGSNEKLDFFKYLSVLNRLNKESNTSIAKIMNQDYLEKCSEDELNDLFFKSISMKYLFLLKGLLSLPEEKTLFLTQLNNKSTKTKVEFFNCFSTLNALNDAFNQSIGCKLLGDFLQQCGEEELDYMVLESFKQKNLGMLQSLLCVSSRLYRSLFISENAKRCMRAESSNQVFVDKPLSLLSYATRHWPESLPFLLDELKLNPNFEMQMCLLMLEEQSENLWLFYGTKFRSPLHYAVIENNLNKIRLLLTAKAEVNTLDLNKTTPLHLACIHNTPEVVLTLLNAGASIDALDDYGLTPLHVAAFYNSDKVIALLLEKGANRHLECPILEQKDYEISKITHNKTAFMIALRCGYKEAVNEFLKIENLKIYTSLELKVIFQYALASGLVDFVYRLIEEKPSLLHSKGIMTYFQSTNRMHRTHFATLGLFNEFKWQNHDLKGDEFEKDYNSEPKRQMREKIKELSDYEAKRVDLIKKIDVEITRQRLNLKDGLIVSSSANTIKALEELKNVLKDGSHFQIYLECIERWEDSVLPDTNQTMSALMKDHKNCFSKFFASITESKPSSELFIEGLKASVKQITRPRLWPKPVDYCVIEDNTSISNTITNG